MVDDWVGAKLAPPTALAVLAKVQLINPMHQTLNLIRIIEHESRFKVAFIFVFGTNTSPGQIRRAHKCDAAVYDDGLGMDPWT